MRLAEPSPAFAANARRFHLYLWKWGKVRFIRYPSGAGVYSYTPDEMPLAVEMPGGDRFRLALPHKRAAMGYFVALRGFCPVSYGILSGKIRQAERLTDAISALPLPELRARFGDVPVAPEDSYASGQCWFGSKAWAEVWIGEPAPKVSTLLARLPYLPPVEVPRFIAAAVFAAAYVVGDDATIAVRGATEADVAGAVAEGRKADGSDAYRLPRLTGSPRGRRQDGQIIAAQCFT